MHSIHITTSSQYSPRVCVHSLALYTVSQHLGKDSDSLCTSAVATVCLPFHAASGQMNEYLYNEQAVATVCQSHCGNPPYS